MSELRTNEAALPSATDPPPLSVVSAAAEEPRNLPRGRTWILVVAA